MGDMSTKGKNSPRHRMLFYEGTTENFFNAQKKQELEIVWEGSSLEDLSLQHPRRGENNPTLDRYGEPPEGHLKCFVFQFRDSRGTWVTCEDPRMCLLTSSEMNDFRARLNRRDGIILALVVIIIFLTVLVLALM